MLRNRFKWAIVGAGPAGIATVGLLLDNKVDARDILWIDPDFKVGDFGQK
jgi:cation diffusion facilitator CzcD-associated flavoprotein CzcO